MSSTWTQLLEATDMAPNPADVIVKCIYLLHKQDGVQERITSRESDCDFQQSNYLPVRRNGILGETGAVLQLTSSGTS
jgi:hypothetical protein